MKEYNTISGHKPPPGWKCYPKNKGRGMYVVDPIAKEVLGKKISKMVDEFVYCKLMGKKHPWIEKDEEEKSEQLKKVKSLSSLLPCPCCGGEAKYVHANGQGGHNACPESWRIGCDNCGLSTMREFSTKMNDEWMMKWKVTSRWNRRDGK
jgi:hypothetical protein